MTAELIIRQDDLHSPEIIALLNAHLTLMRSLSPPESVSCPGPRRVAGRQHRFLARRIGWAAHGLWRVKGIGHGSRRDKIHAYSGGPSWQRHCRGASNESDYNRTKSSLPGSFLGNRITAGVPAGTVLLRPIRLHRMRALRGLHRRSK